MTQPERPTETERLIQATREEARKTRTLLLWIFVGVPALGLIIWGIVSLAAWNHAASTSSETSDTSVGTTLDAPDSANPSLLDPLQYNPAALPANTSTLNLSSTCQQLNTATTDDLHDFDEVWPEVADEVATICTAHPDWTIAHALAPPTNP